jgi:hypothetical protein
MQKYFIVFEHEKVIPIRECYESNLEAENDSERQNGLPGCISAR